MDLRLSGRAALVCAASQGLGRAAAEALASEGCRVAMCSRRRDAIVRAAEEIARETGGDVVPFVADLTRAEDARDVVRSAASAFGGLDILVTNAGGPKPGTFDSLSDEDWYAAVDLLLMSAVRLSREAIPYMRRRGGGRIIHITSVAVKQPVPGLMLSNAVRTAIVGFSKTLARELAPEGITVNCVAPGYTRTSRVVQLAEAAAAREGTAVEEMARRTVANVPMARLGEPRELADLIAFLASDRSGYTTGTVIQVDGGAVAGPF
jgi:3-oxoacyl-[acyl-carrier protein] reductase